MKLLYIYRYCILGGVTTQLANRLRYLAGRCEVHFAFIHDYGGRTALGEGADVAIVQGKKLKSLIERGGFDVVAVIDTPEAYPAIRAAGFSGTVINEVHTTTSNIHYLNDLPEEPIDAFLAPSDYLVRRIEEEFGFGGRVPCYRVPNCLDTGLFRPVPVTRPPEKKIVLWVGKLDEHKNWRGFLDAAQALARSRHECEFWMIGGETAKDETAVQLFRQLGELNLFGRLRWLQRVEYERMPPIYSLVGASGGLLLSTSCDESFGMTLIEALACGCLPVAAEVGALPEILDGPLKQWLYPHFDLDELVQTVTHALDARPAESSAGEWRTKVIERYGIEAAGSHYYETLLEIRRQESQATSAGRVG